MFKQSRKTINILKQCGMSKCSKLPVVFDDEIANVTT